MKIILLSPYLKNIIFKVHVVCVYDDQNCDYDKCIIFAQLCSTLKIMNFLNCSRYKLNKFVS
jgi:hypothetical protein